MSSYYPGSSTLEAINNQDTVHGSDAYLSAPEQNASLSPRVSSLEYGWASMDDDDECSFLDQFNCIQHGCTGSPCIPTAQSTSCVTGQSSATNSLPSSLSHQPQNSPPARASPHHFGAREETACAAASGRMSDELSASQRGRQMPPRTEGFGVVTDRLARRRIQNNQSSRRSRQRKRKELAALQRAYVEHRLQISHLQSLITHLIKHLHKYDGAYHAAMSTAPLKIPSSAHEERPQWFGAAF